MKRGIPISFILPGVGKDDDFMATLRSLKPAAKAVQLISLRRLPEDIEFPHLLKLSGSEPESVSHLINRALPRVQGEFVAVLPPGVEIVHDLPNIVAKWAETSQDADYIYGDYFQKNAAGTSELVRANPCPDDITEREDWGPLEFYRTAALKNIGGCDESLRFRPDYDLRLKLTATKPALHIPEAICTAPFQEPAQVPGADALFFPGRGRFGGFSYLFMSPEEEKEVEEVFYRSLRRRNAYLDSAPGGSFPPPARTSPRVSVIIPVHNCPEFLPLAVGSVQAGRFGDFEVIIVDNASEDETLSVARALADQDPRIKVISLPDNVIAKALNAGFRQARGEYIAQLDSDDEYTPDTLEVMVGALDNHLDWALTISYYELMDEVGKTLQEFGVIKHLEYNRNNILRVDGAGAVRVWRRAAIQEFGGFDDIDFGHYGEDYDLVLKVGEKYEVGRVHQVLYRYRRHPGNSDILRPHEMKIKNKALARQRAIKRRQWINRKS